MSSNRYVLARYRAGLTVEEAAKKAKLSMGTISALETGATKRPSVATAKKLSDAYDCTITDLLGDGQVAA